MYKISFKFPRGQGVNQCLLHYLHQVITWMNTHQLNVTFVFHRYRHSLAVVKTVKYEYDLKYPTLARWKISQRENEQDCTVEFTFSSHSVISSTGKTIPSAILLRNDLRQKHRHITNHALASDTALIASVLAQCLREKDCTIYFSAYIYEHTHGPLILDTCKKGCSGSQRRRAKIWQWTVGGIMRSHTEKHQIDGLAQERRNSSVLAMELRPSCTKLSKWSRVTQHFPLELRDKGVIASQISASTLLLGQQLLQANS